MLGVSLAGMTQVEPTSVAIGEGSPGKNWADIHSRQTWDGWGVSMLQCRATVNSLSPSCLSFIFSSYCFVLTVCSVDRNLARVCECQVSVMLDSATPWTVGCQASKRASKRAPRNVFSATWPPWLLAFSSPCYSTRAYKVSSQQTHFFFQNTSFSLLWAWTNTHTHTLVKSEKKKVVGIARILPVFLFRMVGFRGWTLMWRYSVFCLGSATTSALTVLGTPARFSARRNCFRD